MASDLRTRGVPVSVVRHPECSFDIGVVFREHADHPANQVLWGLEDGCDMIDASGRVADLGVRVRLVTTDPDCVARAWAWALECNRWWLEEVSDGE